MSNSFLESIIKDFSEMPLGISREVGEFYVSL